MITPVSHKTKDMHVAMRPVRRWVRGQEAGDIRGRIRGPKKQIKMTADITQL